MKLSDYKSEMPLINLLILVFLILPMSIIGQSEKPQTIVVPTGSLGEISEVRKKMLEMTLISNLDDHFAIVPKDLFEEAQEKAFEELDYEECTEEQCIMMIKEILQVENSFQLVLMSEDGDTQISLIWNDLDQKRVEEEYCEGCKTKELRKSVSGLVKKLISEKTVFEQKKDLIEKDQIGEFKKNKKSRSVDSDILKIVTIGSLDWQLKTASETDGNSKGLIWESDKLNWNDSRNYCAGLNLVDNRNWRLPNKDELSSLLICDNLDDSVSLPLYSCSGFQAPVILEEFQNTTKTGSRYWTSTLYSNKSCCPWAVNFGNGWVSDYDKKTMHFTRCVSDIKKLKLGAYDQKIEKEELRKDESKSMAYPEIQSVQNGKLRGLSQNSVAGNEWIEPFSQIKFIYIPEGTFLMGSPIYEEGRRNDEGQKKIKINHFWMAETETTQKQWLKIMPNISSQSYGDNLPVDQVNMDQIEGFIEKVTEKNQYLGNNLKFRLPTEAEWEYAARANTYTTYYWGNKFSGNKANCLDCGSKWSGSRIAPVKSFTPNLFGLYDMAGNVWEWTCSINDKKNDAEQKCFDEEGFYGLRGGSWYTNKYSIRSAGFRRFGNKTTELHGFRLVLEN